MEKESTPNLMTYSIYHFFDKLIQNKQSFWEVAKLEEFPFDETMLAYRHDSSFPDLALRVNAQKHMFTGGELIELKDKKGYGVAPFNSQIPQETKELTKLADSVLSHMRQNDSETDNLPIRDVYYLVRGSKLKNNKITKTKICLVSGKFFETVTVSNLIQQAFEQVIDERRDISKTQISEDFKRILAELFSEQESFSKTRQVDNASVSIRFRIMTQTVGPGNILSDNYYPEIATNTLNLVSPYYADAEPDILQHHMRSAMNDDYEELAQFELKHPYNGSFWVFQVSI